MDTIDASNLLGKVLHEKLAHLNLAGQIDGMARAKGAMGASCDIFTGDWRNGDRQVKVAVKMLRFYAVQEQEVAKVRWPSSKGRHMLKYRRVFERLAKEAYIWSKLKHKNVLPLLGFFLDEASLFPCLVSEWKAKGTLFDYLRRHEMPLPVVEVVSMVQFSFVQNYNPLGIQTYTRR